MILKNSNIRRKIVENRYVIFVVIFAIILILYLIQVLNQAAKEQSVPNDNQIQNEVVNPSKTDTSSKTILSNKQVTNQEQETNTKVMEDFIQYCNGKQIEQAYNLLSDECKEEVFFSNIQYFKQNYVDKIFTSQKMASFENWINSYVITYKVKIVDDMLSTGKVTSLQNAIEDYYTVVKQGDENKLNINGYMGRQQINRQVQGNGVTISVLCKNMFKEYETYDITIENTEEKTILLDSQEKVDSMYLLGSNESHYKAYSYEIDRSSLIVAPNETKEITIRFQKIYSNQVNIEKIVWEDIIFDYESYQEYEDKTQYTNRGMIRIEI